MSSAKQLLTYAIHKMSEEEVSEVLVRARLKFKVGTEYVKWTDSGPVNSTGQRVNIPIGQIVGVVSDSDDVPSSDAPSSDVPSSDADVSDADVSDATSDDDPANFPASRVSI